MATSIFPHPSSNDSADKLNYKWMLMLMLLLSVVSFIIPLHPVYNSDNSQDTSPSSSGPLVAQNLKPVKIPTFRAICWAHDSMTGHQMAYASAHCTNKYNAALRGQVNKYVYRIDINDRLPLGPEGRLAYAIKPMTSGSDPTEQGNSKQYTGPDPRIVAVNKFKERARKLVTFQAPITFLVMAVCLGLSQVIWSFLSECCGSFNAGETLKLVGRQIESRESGDISESLGQSLTRLGLSMSILYLLKKLLSLVFVLSLLIFTVAYALPEMDDLHDEFSELSSTPISRRSNATSDENSSKTNTIREQQHENIDDDFLCDFYTRHLDSVYSRTVQCTPVIDNDNTISSNSNAAIPSSTNPSSTVKNLLDFEALLLQIAVAILVVLSVNNLFSLWFWLFKLMCGSTKARIGLHDNASMDLVFLAQMGRINASRQVAHIIVQSSFGSKI